MRDAEKATIIVHSGEFDRVTYALDLASVCLATGMDTAALFTWGALRRLIKDEMNTEEVSDNHLSERVKTGLENGGIEDIEARYENARTLGLEVYACAGAMSALNLTIDDLTNDIDGVTGLAKFVEKAVDSDVSYYI